MSKITLAPNASGTGTLTIAAPNTNTDRTLTLPDVTTTLVGTDATQTLTNKTLTAPTLTGVASIGSGSGVYANNADMRLETATGRGWRMGTTSSASTLGYFYIQGTTDNFSASFIDSLNIDASGNVGIGTSSPVGKLDIVTGTYRAYFDDPGGTSVRLNGVLANNSAYGPLKINGSILAMETGGTERMRIDSSGNVGIGTSSPGTTLDVAGPITARATGGEGGEIRLNNIGDASIGLTVDVSTADTGRLFQTSNNSTLQIGQLGGTGGIVTLYTAATERMRIDASGNVGIGTSSPTGAGTTLATQGAYSSIVAGSTSNASFVSFYSGQTADPNPSILYNNSLRIGSATSPNTSGYAERMRIDASGNVMVGTSSVSNGAKFTVAGTVSASLNGRIYSLGTYNNTTSSGANMHIALDGHIFRSTSSLKYKTNVQDATHGLAEVMTLRPVTYKGKNDGALVFGGLIAEEVHEAGLTEFVQYAEDGSPDALAYGNMVSLCIKAIQEQQQMIQALQADIAALKGV